jgi:para-aminobenzoate synthetase component 1
MLCSLKLPPMPAVGQRLQRLDDKLQVRLEGDGWHAGLRACHAVGPILQLDFDSIASSTLWNDWRHHHAGMPRMSNNGKNEGPAHEGPLPGWYGFLGYEAGRQTPSSRLHNLPVASLGFFPCVVLESDAGVEIRYLAEYAALADEIMAVLQSPLPALPAFKLLSPFTNDTDEARYRAGFEAIVEYIHAGDCYQVNFAQRFSAQFCGNPLSAYESIRHTMNSPYSGYVRHALGSVLSFSPEQFVSLQQGEMRTSPIKGTRPRMPTPEQDEQQRRLLLNSEKDRAENVMIVDLLRNDLSRVAELGSVGVPTLFQIKSFVHVHHMISTVTARLRGDKNAIDVLEACFPGGSITGAPKRRACEIIAELEVFPRSAYCGSLVSLDVAGNMQSNILIRSVVAENDRLFCWGGGGIVSDSDCQLEYEETLYKVGRLMKLFEQCH